MPKFIRFAELAVLAVLLLVPSIVDVAGESYYMTFLTRVMVFAIAALGLNLILGFGGLTSLGHSAFMGVGAYLVGAMVQAGVMNGFMHLAALVLVGAILALAIGALALRTSGLSFIMLTLAFAQLLYFMAGALKIYGGDDGFSFRGRSEFGSLFSLSNEGTLYLVVLLCLAGTVFLVRRLAESRFGMALQGSRGNLRRMESLGLHVYRYQLAAFVISGVICTVAGGLLANLAQFVSPAYLHWSRSADLLTMALLGGMSSVVGPVAGAAALLLLEEALTALTPHWQAPLGIILILVVLYARNGLVGLSESVLAVLRRLRASRAGLPRVGVVLNVPEASHEK